MPDRFKVVLQGFSAFERDALAAFFRLAAQHRPTYVEVATIAQADFVIADADDAGVIDRVLSAGHLAHTVFIGAQAPEGAVAWLLRPIDPLHVQRELDTMVALRDPQRAASPGAHGVPARRASDRPGAPHAQSLEDPRGPSVAAAPFEDVLLVDDSDVALRFLARLVEQHGLHARCVHTSAKALELMARHDFAALFIDVELGEESELDGLALCQHVKQHHRGTTGCAPVVVLVSAHNGEADRVRGALAGCDAYLGKPLDESELVRVLRDIGLGPVNAGGLTLARGGPRG
jgi:CheY-like chemotaxis protein